MNYINNTFPLFFQIVGTNELIFHSKMFKEEPIFDEEINLEDLVFTNQEIDVLEESKENLKPIPDERISVGTLNNVQNIKNEPTEVISNTNENPKISSNGNKSPAINQKVETQHDEITKKGVIKKVTCGFCGKQISQTSMKLHLRVHTGERPFKCDCCDKRFSQRSALKTHLKIHTK